MRHVLFRLGLILPALLGCAARDTEIGDLKTFTSKAGRFTADFPGEPTPSEQNRQTTSGTITVHLFMLDIGGAVEYMAGYTDLPGTITEERIKKFNVEKGLTGARDGIVRATSSRVVKESKVSLGKWPGREWELEAAGNKNEDFRWRCYYVKARQYQIGVGWLKGKEPPKEVVDTFLNSLKLTAE